MSKYKFTRSPQFVEYIETNHRTIKTKIPCEGTEEILRGLEKYESRIKNVVMTPFDTRQVLSNIMRFRFIMKISVGQANYFL